MSTTQIVIQLDKTEVKEGSGLLATVYFRDRAAGDADTPTTVHYRLDCLTTETKIVDWTSVSAASSITIQITGAQNKSQDYSRPSEVKQLTIKADDGSSDQFIETKTYRVHNVPGFDVEE